MSLATPEKIRTFQRKLYLKAKGEPAFRFYQLYDKVHREDILEHAYRLSRDARGSAGVDGETFQGIESKGREEWLAKLGKELRERTYKPDPVKRVLIPKPNGGERPLSIPTIRDRVAQTAAKLVLEPIIEADLEDSAHGYRPKRSATEAVKVVTKALGEGHVEVVDADLSKYFDTIPHPELMKCVARRVVDRHILKLIKAWLKAPVEETGPDGKKRMKGGKRSNKGVPQGGVISPLLANLYMNRFLKAWRQQGKGEQFRAVLVNYADDFVIVSKGRAREALAWTGRVLSSMKLKLSATKTRICNAKQESFDFLGYTFGTMISKRTGNPYMGATPSKKSVGRIKDRIRSITCRQNKDDWGKVRDRLNSVLRGWMNYFSFGTVKDTRRKLDFFVIERVRHFLRSRHKVQSRGTLRFDEQKVFGPLGVIPLFMNVRPARGP